MKISKDDFGILAICAIRYCQGRRSYMPSVVQGIVRKHLSDVKTTDINTMLRDCEDQKNNPALYGDEWIDKPGWLAFKGFIENEQERRKKD